MINTSIRYRPFGKSKSEIEPPCIDCKKGHYDSEWPGAYWGLDFCPDYVAKTKRLPSPRFPIMSRGDIHLSKRVLEASEVLNDSTERLMSAKRKIDSLEFDTKMLAALLDFYINLRDSKTTNT